MNRDELKKQAIGRLKLTFNPELFEIASGIADRVLEPYKARDEAKNNEKTVRPYRFDAQSVLWLERKIRQEMNR